VDPEYHETFCVVSWLLHLDLQTCIRVTHFLKRTRKIRSLCDLGTHRWRSVQHVSNGKQPRIFWVRTSISAHTSIFLYCFRSSSSRFSASHKFGACWMFNAVNEHWNEVRQGCAYSIVILDTFIKGFFKKSFVPLLYVSFPFFSIFHYKRCRISVKGFYFSCETSQGT